MLDGHMPGGERLSSAQRSGASMLIIVWNSFVRKICLFFSHLPILSFLSVWTHIYWFYSVGYNPILFYLLCCSNSSSCGHGKILMVKFYVPLTHPHALVFELSYCLALPDMPDPSCIFSVPALEWTIFIKKPWFPILNGIQKPRSGCVGVVHYNIVSSLTTF